MSAGIHTEHYSAKNRAAGLEPDVHFDIMGLNPELIRFIVDFLGAERVVTGSDWPIGTPVSLGASSEAFSKAGLTPEQQKLVAEGNATRLLELRAVLPGTQSQLPSRDRHLSGHTCRLI